MATLQEIKNRIKAIHSTVKITKVMQLVATSKLGKVKPKLRSSSLYMKSSEKILKELYFHCSSNTSSIGPNYINYFAENNDFLKKEGKIIFIIFTSNKGLCGKLNASLLKESANYINNLADQSLVNIYGIGNKFKSARKNYFKLRSNIKIIDINIENSSPGQIFDFIHDLYNLYEKQDCKDVIIAFNLYKSFFEQTISIFSFTEKLNEIRLNKSEDSLYNEPIFDSFPDMLLKFSVKQYFSALIYNAIINNLASEYSMRISAMDNATRNGQEMAEQLLLVFNKTRQAFITKDLLDIISSSNAIIS